MKISELKDNHEIQMAWGVEIDEEMFDPPANIRTIGLLWEGNAPNAISDQLIDTVIAFTLSGAEVIVEVRPGDEVDHEYLLTLAGNAGFSVAAIPPQDEDDLQNWCNQCAGFSEALLTVPNFARHLFPVTGYMTYLVLEFFGGKDSLTPTDPYTVGRFFDQTPEDWADATKAAMRKRMSDVLGSEDALKDYVGAILKAIHDEAKKSFLEQLRAKLSA
jgi:hypothetical protein